MEAGAGEVRKETETEAAAEAAVEEAAGKQAPAAEGIRLGEGLPEAPVVAWTKFKAGGFTWSLTVRAAGTREEIFDALRLTREIIDLVGRAAEKYEWEPLDENGRAAPKDAPPPAGRRGKGRGPQRPAAPAARKAQADQVARAEAAGEEFMTWEPETFALEYKPDGEPVIRFKGGRWKKYGIPLYVELHDLVEPWVNVEELEPGAAYKWPGPALTVEMRGGQPYKVVGFADE